MWRGGVGSDKIIKDCRMIGALDPIIEDGGSDTSIEFIAPEDAILRQAKDSRETVNETVNETVLDVLRNNP